MGWEEYYRKVEPESFGAHKDVYKAAISELVIVNPDILDPQRILNFVLGGFHPNVGSDKTFKSMCQELHANPLDRHILLDMNAKPLTSPRVKKAPYKIQARLESLPFKNTVDFLFLDMTLNFMKPEQVHAFAKSAAAALNHNGFVLTVSGQPTVIPYWDRLVYSRINHVPYRVYRRAELEKLTGKYLKPVMVVDAETPVVRSLFQLTVFARNDNALRFYQGKPLEFLSESATNQ